MQQPPSYMTTCDKEPIHILGKVQAHGFLIAIDMTTGQISYTSENIADFIKDEPRTILGKDLTFLETALQLNITGSQLLFDQLINTGFGGKNIESMNPYYVELAGRPYNIILAHSGDELIIEFENIITEEFESQKIIGSSISKILSGATLESILKNAAKEIKKIIKYDRVMIYQFSEEGHGKVVAEEREANLPPFLNLHYPASDIPKQARELYKINLTRIIADVDSEPSRIITNYTDGRPLDLTHAELRAVSPMHIQYLKNMGVRSSFSISLIYKGELWGLIACHNYTPRFINYNARTAAKLVGQILSSAIEYRVHEEANLKFESFSMASAALVDEIDDSGQITEALTKKKVTIKDITDAAGVALIFEKKISCLGTTPGEAQIMDIRDWVLENTQDFIFSSHHFPRVYKAAEKYSGVASGILACVLSHELKEMIIWFKPELLENIAWAGNPEKPVETGSDGTEQLSPRKSFESWTETVRHTSIKWSSAEIALVIKMREHIIYAIKRKANEIRHLNEKLLLAYRELDTFSYTVSHDLRTPLSSIKGYSELLLKNESLDDNAKKILERIRKCTDKMALLITEILNYSRVGQSQVNLLRVDVKRVIEELKLELIDPQNLKLDLVVQKTPEIVGDQIMVKQVFSNLIGNAIKYSSKTEQPKIVVNGESLKKDVIYTVSDNGIGIDINYHNKVFELFRRMENAQDIEGTGVGLAIVKKIMEKHKGRIWFESILGSGTTFFIAFPKSE